MTTEIFESKRGNLSVTRFAGTNREGLMVQLTAMNRQSNHNITPFSFIQVPVSEFEEMIQAFVEFKKIKDF